jgi:hypothetical protein
MPNSATKTAAIKAYTRLAECLWRSNASGKYYAFIKSGGKQFHRSLKLLTVHWQQKPAFECSFRKIANYWRMANAI